MPILILKIYHQGKLDTREPTKRVCDETNLQFIEEESNSCSAQLEFHTLTNEPLIRSLIDTYQPPD